MENNYLEPWIETYTGVHFEFLQPKPEMVNITDIAHALSRQCRFGGHTAKFYSVAEHSCNVAYVLARTREYRDDKRTLLSALLHDASEAYLLDVPSPIKQHLPGYKDIEAGVMAAISKRFNFQWPPVPMVHDADQCQLKTEAKWLLPSQGKDWADKFPTTLRFGALPACWTPEKAEEEFLKFFNDLTTYELDTGGT